MTFLLAAGLFTSTALAYDHEHTAFAKVLEGAVTDTGVDYDLITTRKTELLGYLEANADANVKAFTDEQKLAFYVNSYNALTVSLIVTKNQPASIRDLSGGKVWDALSWPIGREKLTLNDIEHRRIRKMTDGRAHAVVNCASKGCPPLPPKPLTPNGLDAQLDSAAQRWARTNGVVVEGSLVKFNKIFNWYAEDFTGMEKGTASEDQMFDAAAKFVTKHGATIPPDAKPPEWNTYDWSLNKPE